MMIRMLLIMMVPFVCFSQTTPSEDIPVNNLLKEKENLDTKRKASYNLEEIKVRWKKAALENCPGVPCIITPPPPSFTCGTSTINDVDGNAYNTVLIGTQCWTTTNLKVTKYNDNTVIPIESTGGSVGTSSTWPNLATGSYTIYGNEPISGTNAMNYGLLYNWYAAAGIITNGGSPTKNICPTGWHVPTDAEWTTLTTYLGGESVAGDKMKSTSNLWTATAGANNSSGFSALPGGYRFIDGSFGNIRSNAVFWSATEKDLSVAWYRNLGNNFGNVSRGTNNKSLGAAVRCLRD